MLAADTAVESRANCLTHLNCHIHKLTDTNLVELCERIELINLVVIVRTKELACVITAEAECHLSKVVSTEAEELSFLSDLVSCKSGTRNLDHCTNLILKVDACCCNLSVCCCNNYVLNELKFLNLTGKRNHDLGNECPIRMSLLNVDSCTDNSLCLHLSNLRICDCKTASTVTHHRVELMERADESLDVINGLALCICKSLDVSFLSRNELMKRRIKETDCNRVAFKSLIELLKVALLIRKNLIKSSLSLLESICTNHLTESSDSVCLEEHMLCTAKTDTLCAELSCLLSICRSICICTNLESSVLISPLHNSAELACDLSVNSRDDTVIDVTC